MAKVAGKDYVRALPGDPDGINFPMVFGALKKIGFQGWVTIMCDCIPGMDPRKLAKQWHDHLKPLC